MSFLWNYFTSSKETKPKKQEEKDIPDINNYKNWKQISNQIKGRTAVQCQQRWNKILQPGLVKGPWSAYEDKILIEWVNKYGPIKWTLCSNNIPGRTGKQCREHWNNVLNNEIKYIKDVFDFVNENKEDAICFDDMKKGIIALGGEINEKEEENLKKENKFNFDDFVNICKQKQINLNNLTNKLLSAFKLLETNKLGHVNKKEIENLLMNNNINEKELIF